VGRLGADPELLRELVAFEQAEDGLRVADVDREQQRRGLVKGRRRSLAR
jgi:hypothetical protein